MRGLVIRVLTQLWQMGDVCTKVPSPNSCDRSQQVAMATRRGNLTSSTRDALHVPNGRLMGNTICADSSVRG